MKKIHILTDQKLQKIIQEHADKLQRERNHELELKMMNKETNLASLQSQMNPHFLYNALECIRGQAILDDAPVIADIARALADYFRYSINSRSDIATLSEELNNVKNYLRIQQFRFDDRFQVEIEYDQDDYRVLETLLPKLTLQPIVENAIGHGLKKVMVQAVIKIKIMSTEKSVNIIISDNGVGMDANTLLRINERIKGCSKAEQHGRHNGIAMPNVNRRIGLMFGSDYGLHVSSIPEIGTDVEVHIPFCTNQKDILVSNKDESG